MAYNDIISSYCNRAIGSYVYNLTASYTDQSNEATVVATSVIMFVLAGLFFNLNLFSRLTQFTSILNPSVRVLLSIALSLFLPVMSYLFSEAKYASVGNSGAVAGASQGDELPLRARLILSWMLLVELIRKKVDAFLVTKGDMHDRVATIERAGRVAFLGNLVFFNLKGAGRKAVFGILWLFCAAKFLQRVAFAEAAKRSYAYGKNAQLLSSYMHKVQKEEKEQHEGSESSYLLKNCKYAVMGEQNLVEKPGPRGCLLKRDNGPVVTVGDIWKCDGKFLKDHPSRKNLCLSFALFKLLRRRFEHQPEMTENETSNCRDLIFKGLCKGHAGTAEAEELFQVINDELHFLSEYYNSVLPVVLASPKFFLINYLLFPITVWGLCLMVIVLCGNGDVHYAFRGVVNDNYILSIGLGKLIRCLTKHVFRSPPAFFATIDLSITLLLALTFVYDEVWEFVFFLLSDWFMVSLVCTYTLKKKSRENSRPFRMFTCTPPVVVRLLRWIRHQIKYRAISVKQFSLVWSCQLAWLPQMMPTVAVPADAKFFIMKRLFKNLSLDPHTAGGTTQPIGSGKRVPDDHHEISQYNSQLEAHSTSRISRAGRGDTVLSIAEIILTWHIATSLVEEKYQQNKNSPLSAEGKVATVMSRYFAYLVAVRPELLPDNPGWTKEVYKDKKKTLKDKLGCWAYYLSPDRTRHKKMMDIKELVDIAKAKELVDKEDYEEVWKQLADFWTDLIVDVASSMDETHVSEHKKALVQGCEFITVLWALATHTGLSRSDILQSGEDVMNV